jgi:hypothetical protein
MIGEGDCGAIGGMKIDRESRSTRRKPAPAPLCPPQIPLDQTRDQTQAAAVGSQRLTAWAMARPDSLRFRNWSETKRFTDALCSKVGATRIDGWMDGVTDRLVLESSDARQVEHNYNTPVTFHCCFKLNEILTTIMPLNDEASFKIASFKLNVLRIYTCKNSA